MDWQRARGGRLNKVTQIPAGKRVLFLWVLVLFVFGAFSAMYWPLRHHHEETAPENFLAYSQKLYARGEPWRAIKHLRQGIDSFHPPYPEPYSLLKSWLLEQNEVDAARRREPEVVFLTAIGVPLSQRAAMLANAARSALAVDLPGAYQSGVRHYLRVLGADLGVALGAGNTVLNMTPDEQLALLRLTGHAVRTDGLIGETGVRAPQDILVMSAGGPGKGRRAHIFLRGRDFADTGRGFHTALINAETGQVTQLGLFDIWKSRDEADRMTRMLMDAPAGIIGAFAVLDDASANFTPALEEAFKDFGIAPQAVILREPHVLGLRYAFAALGVKGADADTGLQAWSPDEFQGYRGHPVACGVLLPAPAREDGP